MSFKPLPIGIDNFKKLIEENYYFVDNSLFIKKLRDNGAQVTLITRPRRFGKTLNLSMIKYFYDLKEKQGRKLFRGLAITDNQLISEAEKYPVVFFTLKGLKDNGWEMTYEGMGLIMQQIYKEHQEVIANLDEADKNYYDKIRNGVASQKELEVSLKFITQCLEKCYQQKIVILIDEYDTPIINGYIHKYFEPVINFMRNFLTEALKSNESLKFAILTGITRVSKENIFSGLNNLEIDTVVNGIYGNDFGFTEAKVKQLLLYYQMEEQHQEVRHWYNGYQFGEERVYNPWSLINYVKHKKFKTYWVNTSSDGLIKDLLRINLAEIKENFSKLIRGEKIAVMLNENVNYDILKTGKDNIWSLFLHSGYLNLVGETVEIIDLGKRQMVKRQGILEVPNQEIYSLYDDLIRYWFAESVGSEVITEMLQELTEGSIKNFGRIFQEIAVKYFSYYDVDRKKGEEFYHAFVLGLFVNLMGQYRVESNRESGYGRSDLLLIPHDQAKRGLVIEIKKQDEEEEQDLQATAAMALQQIKERKYYLELEKARVSEIVELGIGFRGKECVLKY